MILERNSAFFVGFERHALTFSQSREWSQHASHVTGKAPKITKHTGARAHTCTMQSQSTLSAKITAATDTHRERERERERERHTHTHTHAHTHSHTHTHTENGARE